MLFEYIKQCRRKTEIARHKLVLALRTIDPSKIKNKITLPTPNIQFLKS